MHCTDKYSQHSSISTQSNDTVRIHSQMYHTDKYSQHSSIIWPVWLNGCVFVYKLSGCGFEFNLIPSTSFSYSSGDEAGFESHCSYLNFRYCA